MCTGSVVYNSILYMHYYILRHIVVYVYWECSGIVLVVYWDMHVPNVRKFSSVL